jgi:hypothetical protein
MLGLTVVAGVVEVRVLPLEDDVKLGPDLPPASPPAPDTVQASDSDVLGSRK